MEYIPNNLACKIKFCYSGNILIYEKTPAEDDRLEADYIVVGAGSAGCVIANRLCANRNYKVILVEAGGRDWSPMVHVPMASGELIRKGVYGWSYHTGPVPGLGGRQMFWPRGKLLGGSSSINGQVYIRGHPSDFDRWAQRGNRGWSYEEVLPLFKKSECHLDRCDGYHGNEGEWRITRGAMRNPLFDAFISAGKEAGYPACDDFNGAEQTGFGRFDFMVHRGRRQSSAVAFLSGLRRMANFSLQTDSHVKQILWEGKRAVGVEVERGGYVKQFRAKKEVILAAGVIGSPHILMLSGIGDGAALAAHGIEPISHLPGVGKNLQDHGQVALLYGCKQPLTIYQMIRIDRASRHFLQALAFGSGPFAHFPVQGGAFTHSRQGLSAPDTQWHFGIGLGVRRARWPGKHNAQDPLDRDGYLLAPCLLRPESRGEIELASSYFRENPILSPNYLSSRNDVQFFVDAVREARRIADQPAFEPYRDGELVPGLDVQSDSEIEAYVRENFATCHHQVGTCKMGRDGQAVVDECLRVHGVTGLRVADASIMPTITGGNTNAATVMIGEKAATMILED